MPFELDRDPTKLREMKMREMNRILKIPVNKQLSEDILSKFSKATLLPSAEIPSLLPAQAHALVAYLRTGGGFFYIGVGKGKTLISIACAAAAYRKGLRKILLIIPPKLTTQLVDADLPWLRRQIPVNLPVNVISGKSKATRLKASKARSGLFIMSWSQLSIADTDELLDNINPELIIADEAHNLSNKISSRYKRINRYMVEFPETEFVALSGTMGKKSLFDYYHLMQWCLKDKIPMPRNNTELSNWATVLDTTFSEHTTDMTLLPLLRWARANGRPELDDDIAGYRKGFNHRLATTSGVEFSIGEDDIGTSITFRNIPAEVPDDYEGMPELQELLTQLHVLDRSPDGDIIDYAIHKFRHDYELTAGFYNSLTWPTSEELAKRRDITRQEADLILVKSKDYHRANQDYHREVRTWLQENACSGMDTPLLLSSTMYRYKKKLLKEPKTKNPVGLDLFDAWEIKNAFEFDERVERDSQAVRVCDYKVKTCLTWAKKLKKGEGALIWFYNTAMGKWIHEELEKAGLDSVYCDSGDLGCKNINNKDNHKRILVASVSAYREGLNLQTIQHVYYLQFPRAAHYAEQSLGRFHRTGCPYDELVFTTCNSNDFDHNMFSAVLADALFQHQAGSRHKLIYGSYEELPKIASSSTLKEMGIIHKALDTTVEAELNRLFGQPNNN